MSQLGSRKLKVVGVTWRLSEQRNPGRIVFAGPAAIATRLPRKDSRKQTR